MKTIAYILVAIIVPFSGMSAAQAAHVDFSEAGTRHASHIPAAAPYVKGSAAKVTKGLRCFTARASKPLTIQGVRVRKGLLVGYCTDGYVDTYTNDGDFVSIINKGTFNPN